MGKNRMQRRFEAAFKARVALAATRRLWNPSKELPKVRAWLENPKTRELVFEFNINNIKEDLAGCHTVPFGGMWGGIRISLVPLVAWYAQIGLLELHTIGAQGWTTIAGACNYHYWEQRIAGSFPVTPRPRPDPKGLSLVLAHSLAVQNNGRADWAGEMLMRSAQDPSVLFYKWDLYPLTGFMARLFARYRGCELDCSNQPMVTAPAYEAILRAWDQGGTQLQAAIASACDYHVNQTNPNNGLHEFGSPPFMIYAPEILAIYAVRKELGLETPQVDHPLLQSPLAKLPDPFPEYHDELLDAVVARYHEQFGSDV